MKKYIHMNRQMKRTRYEAPQTERLIVEVENCLCAASQMPASLSEDSTIEVEEYDSFDMEVTFD